jgi:hypothetical protein
MQSRSPHHTPRRRLFRAAAAGTVVASLLGTALVVTPSAGAAVRLDPAEAGARWLADELTDDGLIQSSYIDDFTDPANPVRVYTNDYGLTIDAGLALHEVGGHRADVRAIRRAIAQNLDSYISGVGDPGSTYSKAAAKAAAFAERVGANAREFGGVNLVSRIKGTVATTAPIAGRTQDTSIYGDYANVIGQAYAVEVLLERSPNAEKTDRAFGFLLKQQCEDGYFRLDFNPDQTESDQTCDGGTVGEKAADTDTTALVVSSLIESGTDRPRALRAIDDAAAWLAGQQARNGSFGGGTSTEGANTNSTGLAAAALGAVGAERRAAKAAAWIRRFQGYSPKPCRTGLTPERGAIAYDRLGYIAGVTDGITEETQDQWNRAGAQALLALPWADLNRGAPTLTAPKSTVPPESLVRLRVRNLEAGERVCVFARGFRQDTATTYLSKRGRNVALPVPTPAGSADRVYRLKALSGTDRVVVKVRAE